MSDLFFNDILSDPDFLRPTTATGARNDPFGAYSYGVEIEGLTAGGFSEVSGLQVAIDVHRLREGGENLFEHQLPGPASYPQSLTLRRGLTVADLFWDWIQQIARGFIVRRNLTITLLEPDGSPAMIWDVRRAFPTRWSGPELRADGSQVALESVELVHHGIARSAGLSVISLGQRLNTALLDGARELDRRV